MICPLSPNPSSPHPIFPQVGVDFPFDLDSGEFLPQVWERWRAWDPVRMVARHASSLSRDVRPITARPEKEPGDRLIYQNKVGSMVGSSMDFTARAVLSPDGSRLRLSMSPVSGSISALQPVPVVTTPVIPGADMSP